MTRIRRMLLTVLLWQLLCFLSYAVLAQSLRSASWHFNPVLPGSSLDAPFAVEQEMSVLFVAVIPLAATVICLGLHRWMSGCRPGWGRGAAALAVWQGSLVLLFWGAYQVGLVEWGGRTVWNVSGDPWMAFRFIHELSRGWLGVPEDFDFFTQSVLPPGLVWLIVSPVSAALGLWVYDEAVSAASKSATEGLSR